MTRSGLVLLGSVWGTVELLSLASTGVQAQNAPAATASDEQIGSLQEVVVTAQRRSEAAVDVPITIAAISADQLATANVQDLSDIQQLTPSLRFDNQTGFFQPSIRGIGTGVTTSGGGANVGIYLDGFYSPNPQAADFQLLNVTGIQVLKGPQGTLFGHNTTGGAILVSTAEPSQETHVKATVDYGSFNAQKYQGYATTGLLPGLSGDVTAIFAKGNGWITNIFDNNDHVGAYENWTVRTGIKYDFNDRVSALLRYTHVREDDPTSQLATSNYDTSIDPTTGRTWGIQTLAVPGTFTLNPNQTAQNLPSYVRSNNDILQLTVKADAGFADLTSYSQWRQEDSNQSENLDQTSLPIFQLGLPIFDSTFSQEFLLASKPGTRLQWTTGFFFFSNRDEYITYIDNFVGTPAALIPAGTPLFPGQREPLGGSSTTTKSFAYYLDSTYEILPSQLYFTAGVRVSRDFVEDAYWNSAIARTRTYVPSINSNKVTPRAVIRYKPTDRSSVYASFSEGYKARIIDVGGSCQNAPFICNPVQPEDVFAYEVGYKFDGRNFSNDVAFFDYQYKNLQVSEFLGNAEAFIVNAAQSRIYGLEDTIHYNVGSHLQLNGGASWTHARYTTFGTNVRGQEVGAPVYQTCPGGLAVDGCYSEVNTSNVLHNVHMQHTPDWSANLNPRVTSGMTDKGEFAFSANVYYSSRLYFSPAGTQFTQPGYTTVGVRAQWDDPSKHYLVALYGDNVTNIRYRNQVQYNGFGIAAGWDAPAVWGIQLGAKF
jgi:iron complex outermembrane recepter protein